MSSKLSKETLIAYLYDELSTRERKRVEQYLKDHPEDAQSLKGMKKVREVMGEFRDKEVIEPAFKFPARTDTKDRTWMSAKIRYILAIAASFTLLIISGFATDMHIKVGEGNLVIGFGEQDQATDVAATDKTAELIETYLQSNKLLKARLETLEIKLVNEITNLKNKRGSEKPQDNDQFRALKDLAGKIQEDNREALYEYLEANRSVQEQAVRDMLVEFSVYLEDQRQQDLQILQARMDYLKQDSEFNQFQTEQMFSSLISTVKNQNN